MRKLRGWGGQKILKCKAVSYRSALVLEVIHLKPTFCILHNTITSMLYAPKLYNGNLRIIPGFSQCTVYAISVKKSQEVLYDNQVCAMNLYKTIPTRQVRYQTVHGNKFLHALNLALATCRKKYLKTCNVIQTDSMQQTLFVQPKYLFAKSGH